MPHQCVRCGKLYEDGEIDIIVGCQCGAKMFYYLKSEKYRKMKEDDAKRPKLAESERLKIEEEVYDILGNDIDRDKPVILDIESIEVLEPGKYRLDLVKLFQTKEPFIIKLEDGKYYVDLVENFSRLAPDKSTKTKKSKKR